MLTKLNERDELMAIIDKLSYQDCQKLTIFLTGIEEGRKASKIEQSGNRHEAEHSDISKSGDMETVHSHICTFRLFAFQ